MKLTFLIIEINNYNVGAGDLGDPLYRLPSELPSECETVLINNLKQNTLSGGRQIKYFSYLAPSGFRRKPCTVVVDWSL